MDYRLGITILLTAVATALAARWWWPDGLDGQGAKLADLATIPLVIGVVTARVATVLLEHPAGIVSLRELTIIRGGTEFWIGVAAGVAAIGLTVKTPYLIGARVALLAPFGLIAYGVYHAGCVVRDGCPGPPSPIGLSQADIDQTVIPVGFAEGLVAVAAGLWFMRRPPSRSPVLSSAVVLGALVAIRTTASMMTPSVVGIPNRDQILGAVAAAVAVGLFLRGRRDAPQLQSGATGDPGSDGGTAAV